MKEFEEELNNSCRCCDECNCGEDCHCTPDNKCCDECTCDTNCNCNSDKDCEGEHNTKCECEDNCTCGVDCECDDGNKCSDNCTCDADENCNCNEHCDCGDDCDCTKDDKCDNDCDCDKTVDENNIDNQCDADSEEDKCKCGCGESVDEETTADAYFRQLLSLRAEFDNYRKRTQGDISKAYSNGFNQAITEFLPALDSFKMASEYITDPNTLMGIQYIEKGILSTLEKMGVQVIDVTQKFDPNLHQAIGSEVSPEHESGDIIKECFKGFILGDKVIRYSQVIVAK